MLIHKQTRRIFTPKPGKEYSPGFLAQFDEYKTPASHKGAPGFAIEERARIKK